jgi:uncharacterized membrane protein YbhN (UPF0104 family)
MGRVRAAWPWLRIALGLGIVGVLLARLGTQALVDGLRVINAGELVAALAIGAATTALSAGRWCLVAGRLGLRMSFAEAVCDYYRAIFLNSVLPAGVLGDVHRAVRHGRQNGDVGRGVRAVVLERTAGQVVIIAAGAVALLAGPAPAAVRGIVLVVLAVAAGLGIVVLVSRRRARVRRAIADLRAGLLARDVWPGVLLLSVLALAGYVLLFVVAARAAGVSAPAIGLVAPVLLSLLAMGLPLNVGGWGPREGVAALMFSAAGMGATAGLTTAMVYGVLALVASLPGAGILMAEAFMPRRREALA